MKVRQALWSLRKYCPVCGQGSGLVPVTCPACGHVAALCDECGRGWSHVAVTTARAAADPAGTACPNCGEAVLADFPAATADQLAAAGLTRKDYE